MIENEGEERSGEGPQSSSLKKQKEAVQDIRFPPGSVSRPSAAQNAGLTGRDCLGPRPTGCLAVKKLRWWRARSMPRCAHGRGHEWMRSSAHTLAAVGEWTARGQSVGAGAAGVFPKRRDRVGSPGWNGGGRWSWRFGLLEGEPWRGGREEGYFTFLSGEWEEGIAWWEGYGGDGDVKDEEVG